MKIRTMFLLLAIFAVSACSSESEKSTGPMQTRSIVGSWQYVYPESRCEELYEFAADNTFTIRSADEIVSGSYSFQDTVPQGNRHTLSLNITADNQLIDCEGKTKNYAGSVSEFFIEFYSDNEIGWTWKDAKQQSTINLFRIQEK